MCGPKFCSMKISQDIRKKYNPIKTVDVTAIDESMEKKSKEFREQGSKIYQPV